MLYFLPSIEFNIKICFNKKFKALQKTELFFLIKTITQKNQCGKSKINFKEDLIVVRKELF